jgi:Flp pilus assembly protein TadD
MTDAGETARARALEERLATIGDAVRYSDFARASRLSADALDDGFEHPALYSLRALGLEQAGRLVEALADLECAVELAPQDYTAYNAMGLCLMQMDRLPDAVSAFEAAVRVGPAFPPAYFNLGRVSEQLGRLVEAERAFERAVELNGDYVEPIASLSDLALRRGDLDTARRWAERAAASQPDNPRVRLSLANVALAQKAPGAALEQLERLIAEARADPLDNALALGLLGDAFDELDKPAEAFGAYTACNRAIRALNAQRFEGRSGAEVVSWMTTYFRQAQTAPWVVRPRARDAQEPEVHAFLLGFPRSGTSLLEHALASHPEVVTLEERNTLVEASADFLCDADDLEVLETLSEERLDVYRRAYWRRVNGFGVTPSRKVFIDKQPLNTVKLPLIAKLFPRAKVMFAQRDPRDVVFSCFRHRFQVNAMTYETLDLERCARFYDGVMTLRELFRAKLQYEERVVVYEALVQAFASEAAAVCSYLGLEWREEMNNFAARARAGQVATVSGGQIAKGLYQSGAGQWRRYARELAPALEIVKPWVERFGYPAD